MNFLTSERIGLSKEELGEIRKKTSELRTAERRGETVKKKTLLAELTNMKNALRRKK